MTILVDGPSAVDIEELETRIERDVTPTAFGPVAGKGTAIKGSFKLPSCFSGTRAHSGVLTHNSNLAIITDLEDKPGERWHLIDCHITSQRIDKHGSHFQFTAEKMRREII